MQEFNLVVLYLCKFPEIALRLHMNVMKLKVVIVEDSTTELNDNWRCLESNPQIVEGIMVQLHYQSGGPIESSSNE